METKEIIITMLAAEYLENCILNGATKEQALKELESESAKKEILKRANQILTV